MDLPELARWIELADAEGMANAVLASAARGDDGVVEPIGSARLMYGGPGPFSQAGGLGFDGEVSAETMARVRAFYAQRGVPARVSLCPFAHASLFERAREAGLGVMRFADVLVRPMPGGEDLEPRDDGLELRRVDPDDLEQVMQAADVMVRAFEDGGAPPDPGMRLEKMLLRQPDAVVLVAWRGGEPAGASMAGWGHDRVALFAGGTLPAHRRQGVQTAMMRERLRLGQERGVRLAVVSHTPGVATRRNAERLGFRHAYTRVVLTS